MRGVRELITERYTGWADAWGLSLAFAVTQSAEKAERTVADAIVALIASEAEDLAAQARLGPAGRGKASPSLAPPPSANAVLFASVVWELSAKQAYRGFGGDSFFRMPAVARAIAILKTKARFSRAQIAAALDLKPAQVADHLENARLLFSGGRSWLSPGSNAGADVGESGLAGPVDVVGDAWLPSCPNWSGQGTDLQDTFARYVGDDLDAEDGRKLHSHLVVCSACRTSFSRFKQRYLDWVGSIPLIEPAPELSNELRKVTRLALKTRRGGPPRFLPGFLRVIARALTRGHQ